MATYYEPAFGLDNFGKPLVYEDWEAIAKAILIVLFGRPGFYPSIPQLGIHIQDYTYKRMDEIDVDVLKAQIAYQLPFISALLDSNDLQISKTRMIGTNDQALLIAVPMYKDRLKNTIAITIVANEESMTYNYALVESSLVLN
jgi:hypothetical protein